MRKILRVMMSFGLIDSFNEITMDRGKVLSDKLLKDFDVLLEDYRATLTDDYVLIHAWADDGTPLKLGDRWGYVFDRYKTSKPIFVTTDLSSKKDTVIWLGYKKRKGFIKKLIDKIIWRFKKPKRNIFSGRYQKVYHFGDPEQK